MTLSQLYETEVKKLTRRERLQLARQILGDLEKEEAEGEGADSQSRSLLELEGLGAEIWEGVDAQAHVDELRAEWDQGL